MTRVSVVVRSRDEAPRLRLTLASLAGQGAEIVVVDDGSMDATATVIDTAMAEAGAADVVAVRHAAALGRSAAANAGARAATGDVLLFLDGDTLAGPGCVSAHEAAHRAVSAAGERIVGRGETWHLRATRFLADPEAGTPWPDQAERFAALPGDEIGRMRVTRDQVAGDFAAIAARAAPGVYPGAAPRRLHALEMAALRDDRGCAVLWAAASGSNLSVPRDAFIDVGGFDEALDINEHRELALRLCGAGLAMRAVEGARTYHLTHRSGWRDPLVEGGWEARFRARHPEVAVEMLTDFWRALADAGSDGLPGTKAAASLSELGKRMAAR